MSASVKGWGRGQAWLGRASRLVPTDAVARKALPLIRAGKVKWEIPETRTAAEQASEVLDKVLGQD